MKVFIDSADIDEIEKALAIGIDGVTTNPSLLKEAVGRHKKGSKKLNLDEYMTELVSLAKGIPVSLEVTKTDYEGMVAEATILYQKFNPIANNVVIKIPINPSLTGKGKTTDSLKAIKTLASQRIPVNCTLIFTPEQALLAAKAGATYLSLFAGRIDDMLRDQNGIVHEKSDYFPEEGFTHNGKQVHDNGIVSGVALVRETTQIVKIHNLKAQVLAASIRNPRQLRELAGTGAHIATVPFDVLLACLNHPKSTEGLKKFMDDTPADYAKLASKK